MKNDQETGDDRDNRRVFAWGASAAILVFIGALTYFYAVDKRGEAPPPPPPPRKARHSPPLPPRRSNERRLAARSFPRRGCPLHARC
jgi:hypothetical protein